jgi:hypothetical protein
MRGIRPRRVWRCRVTRADELQLRALVEEAWEVRRWAPSYLADAAHAIVDWHERRHLRAFERRMSRFARVAEIGRECERALAAAAESRR